MGNILAQVSLDFIKGDTIGKGQQALSTALSEMKKTTGIQQKIYALQAAVTELPEVNCPLQHLFAPDVYIRTIFIPAGTCIVGKIHKHAHANILSQGQVTVVTEGGGVEHLEGPVQMVSEPGTKRAVYAHTDVVWTTIHPNPTNTTNVDEIEEFTIAKTYGEYLLMNNELEVPSIEVLL